MKDEDKHKLGIWGELFDIALEDGHITADESMLLKKLFDNAEIYRNVLEQAFEDGQISKDDKSKLMEQREKIVDLAYETAEADEVITEEELALINKTLEITKQLELNEHHLASYWT